MSAALSRKAFDRDTFVTALPKSEKEEDPPTAGCHQANVTREDLLHRAGETKKKQAASDRPDAVSLKDRSCFV